LLLQDISPTEIVMEKGNTYYEVIPLDSKQTSSLKLLSDAQYPLTAEKFLPLLNAAVAVIKFTCIRGRRRGAGTGSKFKVSWLSLAFPDERWHSISISTPRPPLIKPVSSRRSWCISLLTVNHRPAAAEYRQYVT
jgi:hypothetical protein